MNLIQQQADDFYSSKYSEGEDHKEFIQELRWELDEYNKASHRLEFIDRIQTLLKKNYDNHLQTCNYPNDRLECRFNKSYENSLFFVQNEKENLIQELDTNDFLPQQRESINESLEQILKDLRTIKLGQEVTYDDLLEEMNELKEYYYLSKKPWTQLVIGKLSGMVAGGIISETVSKQIVDTVIENYQGLIK